METTELDKPRRGRPPGPRKEEIVVGDLTDEQIETVQKLAYDPTAINIIRGGFDPSEVFGMMHDFLLEMRVRTIAGYKRGRCLACNHPHTHVPCPCAHHKVVEYLKQHGLNIDL